MRVLIFVLSVLASGFATQLLSSDDIEHLFRKYAINDLSKEEFQQFQDVLEILHRPEHVSIKSLDESSPVRTTIDCLVCRSAFATVFEGVHNGQTDDEITNVVTSLCTGLGIENHNVCYGAILLNVPIITHIIKTKPDATPRTFCGHVLQNSGNPNMCHVDDPRFDWVIDLPPPSAPATPPVEDTRPLKIALLTDAHIDPLYEAFGVGQCGEPTCCRVGQSVAPNYIYKSNVDESIIEKSIVDVNGEVMVDLSEAPKVREMRSSSETIRLSTSRNPEPAGYWGDFRNCDTPLWAYDDVIERITETHKDIDVVYYIGDTIDHGVWETTYELIDDMNRYLIDKMRKGFGDDVLVVPTLGNHESQPTNQFAPSSVTEEYLNTTWLYNKLVDKWGFYLKDDEAKQSLRERGEFSVLVRPGLRAISINNNVVYKFNWWLAYDPLDGKKHLDWLVSELYKAEQRGEKVHIISHIPAGSHDLTHAWTREYNRIINRFASTITAEFNGHTHADQFKIFYSPEGNPINVAWGAGSTTSYTFYNLNYKILNINSLTFEVEGMVNYVYNLTEANLTPNRRPHWFQLYDMKTTYGLTDLSPVSIDNLVHRMVTSERHLLDIYAAFHSKLSDARWPYCDNNCKIDRMCYVVTTVLWDRQKCEELRSLFFNR